MISKSAKLLSRGEMENDGMACTEGLVPRGDLAEGK